MVSLPATRSNMTDLVTLAHRKHLFGRLRIANAAVLGTTMPSLITATSSWLFQHNENLAHQVHNQQPSKNPTGHPQQRKVREAHLEAIAEFARTPSKRPRDTRSPWATVSYIQLLARISTANATDPPAWLWMVLVLLVH
ncbi:hypothetical protein BR93DRAFT_775166 [Coniochaeta sp. PMI_546]|nr:hypothetical protein BR93DRAFT_775166 [Coniochaeta sp. PMI_546]